jgi:hypothetical protein
MKTVKYVSQFFYLPRLESVFILTCCADFFMSLFSSLFKFEDRSCFQGGTKFLNNITSNHMVFVLYITIQNNTSTIMAKSNNRRSTMKGGKTKANIGKKKNGDVVS